MSAVGQVLPIANSLDRTHEGQLHFGTGRMGNSGLSANADAQPSPISAVHE
jgi:hypothetical protein